MSRISSWLRGSRASGSNAEPTESALDESEHLSDALHAAALIMNDDIEGAEKRLQECNSSFHHLGRGVTKFMRSLLGFERDVIAQASEALAEAENTAWADMKRSQREKSASSGGIYPPGSEYAMCNAQAQLMAAVVGVLNESLTESLRGFYKLRKAYMTLDGIINVEERYIARLKGVDVADTGTVPPALTRNDSQMPGGFGDEGDVDEAREIDDLQRKMESLTPKDDSPDDSDDEFVDAAEVQSGTQTPLNYQGLATSTTEKPRTPPATPKVLDHLQTGPSSEIFTDPLDAFIHSGSNLCYGLLLLILSLVPPAFSKLLSVIGFRGDRERGITLLWQSTKFDNINGAVAVLALLAYYNSLVGLCDIIPPSDDILGYPHDSCVALLKDIRIRYPQSRMWKIEEARIKSTGKDLKGAIEVLQNNTDSKMRQITALNMFEKSLNSLYAHDYALCAESFIACTKLNTWSQAFYYYMAGSAQVELYRNLRSTDPNKAAKHKEKAEQYLRKAPAMAGKRKMLSKGLPFDTFVVKRMQKWEERAKEWNVHLIDAIGNSPTEEMIYIWNGTKRMGEEELHRSLGALGWKRATHAERLAKDLDEQAMFALLRANLLRNLGRTAEAKKLLEDEVLCHDRNEFKGGFKDDWSCPSAHYEMAVIAWMEKDIPGPNFDANYDKKLTECEQWLDKLTKWESFVMDSRIGLKVTTGLNTVKRTREKRRS